MAFRARKVLGTFEKRAPGHVMMLSENFQLTDASSSSWSGPSPRFCTYLNGRKFYALTGSNPLMYLVTSTKLSATDHHLIFQLPTELERSIVTRTASRACLTAAVWVPNPYQMKIPTSSPSWVGWLLQRIQWFVHLILFRLFAITIKPINHSMQIKCRFQSLRPSVCLRGLQMTFYLAVLMFAPP